MRAAAAFLLLAAAAAGQDFSQRGYLETDGFWFPQTARNDRSHAVGEWLFRYDASYKLAPGLIAHGGLAARTDTHHQTDREFELSWWDRGRRRPAFAVDSLSAVYTRGRLTVEAGKQFVRWGKTDVLNPTDRFAPRDYLNVVEPEYLAITAARATYGTQANTIDLVFEPRLTPARVPLLDQRWAVVPEDVPVTELPPVFPGGPSFGARWNHIGRSAEYSFSFFNGHDCLPLYDARPEFTPALRVSARRFYPQMRMYGADLAAPIPYVTLKAEAGYFTSTDARADEYALYVIQLERQQGEWSFIGGYAGEVVTRHGEAIEFSPARGLARSFVARAGYTIDTNRALAIETVVRQNGHGMYVKPEYTQAFGQHWRATAGFAVIRGDEEDFLGEYRHNSFAILTLRYSF